MLAAPQPLLLAGEPGVHDRGVEPVAGQHAGGLDHACHPGGVVVRARSVGLAVEPARGPRVDVARHDHVAPRIGRPPLDRDHVHDGHRVRQAARAADQRRLVEDLEAAAAAGGDRVELGLDPAAGGADPAGLRQRVGQRVPGAEAGQAADVRLDPLGRDGRGDLVQRRLLGGGHGARGGWGLARSRKRRSEKGAERHAEQRVVHLGTLSWRAVTRKSSVAGALVTPRGRALERRIKVAPTQPTR